MDVSIHFFKRLLYAQGAFETSLVRQPIWPFDEIHARHAARLIELAIDLERAGEEP